MAQGFQGAVLKSIGAQDYQLTVVAVSEATERTRRIRFYTPNLFDDYEPKPTGWLRFWFPDLENPEKRHQRAYTIIEADVERGEFSVDFLLHQPSGPASTWATRAEVGQQLMATLYGASDFTAKDEATGYLVIGDGASLPSINSLIPVIPAHVPVELYFAVYHPEDRTMPISEHPALHVTYVDVTIHTEPTALAEAIEARDWSDWLAWVSGEIKAVRGIKQVLKDIHGFPASEIKAQPYWARAKSQLKAAAKAADAPVPAPVIAQEKPKAAASPVKAQWQSQAGNRLLQPVKRHLIVAGVVQVLIALLEIAPFVLITELARRILSSAPVEELVQFGVWALILLGLGTALSSAMIIWMHIVDARFALKLKQSLVVKLARLPLGWFIDRGSGSVKHLIQDDTASLHYLVTHAALDIVAAVVAPLVVLVYLLIVDVRLTLIMLVPLIAYIIVFASMVQASSKHLPQSTRWAKVMNEEANQFLAGMPVIRVFGGSIASMFSQKLEHYVQFFVDWQRPFIQKKVTGELLSKPTTFLWIIVTLGTLFITAGWMQPVNLLPFLLIGTTFGSKLLAIMYGAGGLREGTAAALRLGLALEEKELQRVEQPELSDGTSVGQVEFRDVTFGYQPSQPVIHDVSFTLRAGTVTGLVGPSGGGKSTIASLLARFYDIDSGKITVGGRDIRAFSAENLYRHVGFVFQSVQTVQASVRENIALARPSATLAEVEQAARLANIHEEIMALPNGYDTVLGEEVKLSGGQVQRVTIARALLADPQILVLDEATAFIDPDSEYLVQQALSNLMKGRTVLIIAHRLHTIMSADQLLVVDKGRIVQHGTHDALVAADGLYAQLWKES